MQAGVHVKSLEALEGMRAAVCIFGDEAGQALSMLDGEIGRFVDWLEHDQLSYWRHEIRLREERLGGAKTDLHRCLSATIDPQRIPSCYQEKKVVEAAKRSLEEAEQKLAAVRRWIPVVRQAVFEYRLKVEPLSTAVASDLPRAASAIDSSIARILAYLQAAPASSPRAPVAGATSGAAARESAALPAAEAAPEQPAPRASEKTAADTDVNANNDVADSASAAANAGAAASPQSKVGP